MKLLTVKEALEASEECAEIALCCPICGEHKNSLERMMNHLLYKHFGHSENIHCSYCDAVFNDHAAAERHLEKHKSTGITGVCLTFSGPKPADKANATKIVQLAVFRLGKEKKKVETTDRGTSMNSEQPAVRSTMPNHPSTSKAETPRVQQPHQLLEKPLRNAQGQMIPDDRFCKEIPLNPTKFIRDPRVKDTGPPRFSHGVRPKMDIPHAPFVRREKVKCTPKDVPQSPLDTPPEPNPTPTPSPKPSIPSSAERKRKHDESSESPSEKCPPPTTSTVYNVFIPPHPGMMMPPPPCMMNTPPPGYLSGYRGFWNTAPPPMPHMGFPEPSGFGGNQMPNGPPGWTPNCGGGDYRPMSGPSPQHHQFPTPDLQIPPPPLPPSMESTPRRPKDESSRPSSNGSSMSISPPSPPPKGSLLAEALKTKKRHQKEQEKLRRELTLKKVKMEEPQ